MTRRDVWGIARELAMAIADSPELLDYRRTEDAVLADGEALDLIRDYEESKRAVKFSKTQPPAEQVVLIEHFMAVEEQFNSHAVIQAHWAARERLDAFLDRVNAVVTYPITGHEEPKAKGGCGSSGGSCGCGG
ncbi:MAG TPA: YlbF family regulator [Symbiobacteriaceae bacterium]